MGLFESSSLITTVLVVGGVAAALIYGYMEYQVRMLRTQAVKLPTGLLFTSKFLTVGTRNASQEVSIKAPMGRHVEDALAQDVKQALPRQLAVVLPAIGLTFEVKAETQAGSDTPSDRCSIRFSSSNPEKLQALGLPAAPAALIVVDNVPVMVARNFQSFAAQMGMWIERVEHRVQLDRDAAQKKQEEAEAELARAEAAAQRKASKSGQPKDDLSKALSEEERQARAQTQIAEWRKAAGFKGSSSEMGVDPRGKVQWFIDLDPTGRVILHANNRTFHGSLKGAKITTLTGELELGVRDALWSEDEPQLSNFNIMAGVKPETRLAWKERIEILVRSLR